MLVTTTGEQSCLCTNSRWQRSCPAPRSLYLEGQMQAGSEKYECSFNQREKRSISPTCNHRPDSDELLAYVKLPWIEWFQCIRYAMRYIFIIILFKPFQPTLSYRNIQTPAMRQGFWDLRGFFVLLTFWKGQHLSSGDSLRLWSQPRFFFVFLRMAYCMHICRMRILIMY